MIEYAVKNNPDTVLMTDSYELFQVIICAKTAVDCTVVCSLIAVSY